ncbi:MAG: hypothetical protein HFG80_07920 [Eubacterium sp.]|nr:hypothetical protein [Eubacterium sp.]
MRVLKSMNFGAKGWILLFYTFMAFAAQIVFTGYVQNVLADLYGGGVHVSSIYTAATIAALAVQIILSGFMAKIKSIHKISIILGAIALAGALGVTFVPAGMMWDVCYFVTVFMVAMWALYSLQMLIGQWFPTKKGTFMGIATLAFPVFNGLMGPFANAVFGGGMPNVAKGMIPIWIIIFIAFLLGSIFLRDFPEQCGALRDNDKTMTPEKANAMLEADLEARKTTVWKTGKILATRDYWLITIPIGALLMCAVGMMTKTADIIGSFGSEMDRFGGFGGIMFLVMVFGIIGSFVIGLIDTAIGTKKAIIISCVLMVVSGILGLSGSPLGTFLSIEVLAVFMGASSNFAVSVAAQYWRREDFSTIFSTINPVSCFIQAIGPVVISIILGIAGSRGVFGMIFAAGIISVVFSLLFSPKHIKSVDDKRRAAAGKALDDELAGRM